MAKRQRDHAAEYARRKARAQAAGYRSVYEAKQARKALGLKRTQRIIPKDKLLGKSPREYREWKDLRAWSLKHSRQKRSKYRPSQGSDYETAYFKAYVNRKEKPHEEILADLKDYLFEYEGMTDEEWEESYAEH